MSHTKAECESIETPSPLGSLAVFAPGFDDVLDERRSLSENGQEAISQYEQRL